MTKLSRFFSDDLDCVIIFLVVVAIVSFVAGCLNAKELQFSRSKTWMVHL